MAAITTAFTMKTPQTDAVYPTSDGRPMGETDLHRNVMVETIETLKRYYAGQQVYVSGNILVFYRPGNKRRHVSPDVMVVRDIEHRERDNYLLWEEGRSPNVVIEVTSQTTRDEDLSAKMEIYQDEIAVAEYFLFDPRSEYLNPSLQGYRLDGGRYLLIEPVSGRLPSRELGLHIEADGRRLRLYDPASQHWLLTPDETIQEKEQAWMQESAVRRQAEAEVERLRQELAELKKKNGG